MADLSGDRGRLIPAYNPANQLNPCLRQNVSGKSLVTSIPVTHLAFLKAELGCSSEARRETERTRDQFLGVFGRQQVCGCSAVAMSRLSV
jgi:hypothetical protein